MDRQHLPSVVAAEVAVGVEVVAVAAVAGAEEKQRAAAWMREMSLPMEVSYLNRRKP